MSETMTRLEQKLAAMHGRRFCMLVARATTGIYLALRTLGDKPGKVALPSVMCMNPANAVIYAGLTPVYCDVSRKHYNCDPGALEALLKQERDIRAVVIPHLYGQAGDLDALMAVAKKHRVLFIEDVAQALGGEYGGRLLGSFGAISVLSFGHTKIIDVDSGGALLFDDPRYWNVFRKEYGLLPPAVKNLTALKAEYVRSYYGIAALYRKNPDLGRLYFSFPSIFKDVYLYRSNHAFASALERRLGDLKDEIAIRREHAAHYRTHLQHRLIAHPAKDPGGAYWRYSFIVKDDRQQEIAEAIRKHNVHVSNWYPPVHKLYQLNPPELKNAEYVGGHIFNLWTDPKVTKKQVRKNIDTVLRVLDQYTK